MPRKKGFSHEEKLASNRRWREQNREKLRADEVVRRAANPGRNAEYLRARRAAGLAVDSSPARGVADQHNYRARKLGVDGLLTEADILDAYAAAGHACQACGADSRLSTDHIVALSRGGPNVRANIQILCRPCNSAKSSRTEAEFRALARWAVPTLSGCEDVKSGEL